MFEMFFDTRRQQVLGRFCVPPLAMVDADCPKHGWDSMEGTEEFDRALITQP